MLSILVLEDDQYTIRTLFRLIRLVCKHEFTICRSVKEGIHAFNSKRYDLVICDLGIKGRKHQGEDFLNYMRERDADIPIMVLTGMEYVGVHTKENGTYYMGHHIASWKKKPITYIDLLKKIEEIVGGSDEGANCGR